MRRPRHKLQVSTFPFLAVLLAAMGALILLLLVMDRRAHIVARNKALEAYRARQEKQQELEKEAAAQARAAWQQKKDEIHAQLLQEEAALRAEVEKVRAQLAAAHRGIQSEALTAAQLQDRLRAEKARLEAKQQALVRLRLTLEEAGKLASASNSEIARLTADLLQLEAQLRDLKQRKISAAPVYSLVPYRGKMGDARRPIYVECAADGIVFHPEGLRLAERDLDVLRVRAEVQRRGAVLVKHKDKTPRQPGPSPATRHPYVLFLVRPDGIENYYRAQAALKGFDLDFGYEFIDADWVLDVPAEQFVASATTSTTPPSPESSNPAVTFRPAGEAAHAAQSNGSATTTNASAGQGGHGSGSPAGGVLGHGALGKGATGNAPSASGLLGKGGFAKLGPAEGTGKAGQPTGSGIMGGNMPTGIGAAEPQVPGSPGTPVGLGKPVFPHMAQASSAPGGPAGSETGKRESTGPLAGPVGQPQAASNAPGPRQPATPSENPSPGSPEQVADGAKKGPRAGVPGEHTDPGNPLDRSNLPAIMAAQKKPPPAPSLGRLLGNRDYVITIECFEQAVALFPGNQTFAMMGGAEQKDLDDALVRSVLQLIARRQATVRPGETPYRPILRFQVHPEGLRTYFRVYPLFENLRMTMMRENLEN